MDTKIKVLVQWLGRGSINIFGRPFSGKDTQGEILAKIFGAPLIGGGDILRSHHEPKKIEEILARGGIIPSDFYMDIIVPYLSRPEFRDKPLILSAVGRSHGEEPLIIKAAGESGHPLRAVILLQISEAEVWQRFEASRLEHDRGERSDDREVVLKNRLLKFREKTEPVIEYYKNKGLLLEVDGSLSRESVTEKILDSLAETASQ